jgi:hypothetical protein
MFHLLQLVSHNVCTPDSPELYQAFTASLHCEEVRCLASSPSDPGLRYNALLQGTFMGVHC